MTVLDRALSLARRIVPKDSFLRRHWRTYRVARQPSRRLLAEFAELHPQARFVQIGSNDGIKLDPVRAHILRREWRGVLVEPIPYLFAQLKTNYAPCADRLVFENVAIATTAATLPFYHLARVPDPKAEGLPSWYDALGSFRRDVIAAHVSVIPDIEQRIVQLDLPAITFDMLCRRNGIAALDLLHMDTEGYDFELLKSIDFTRYRPLVVIYEHTHLSRADQAAAQAYLGGHGYEALADGMDTWCLNVRDVPAGDRRLLNLWHRLRRP